MILGEISPRQSQKSPMERFKQQKDPAELFKIKNETNTQAFFTTEQEMVLYWYIII